MPKLFPDYADAPGGYLNLDDLARPYVVYDQSPFLDPYKCEELVARAHAERRWVWSYGGYFEKRDHLWRGGYMAKTDSYTHLGVDFNVPAGTAVAATVSMRIMRIDNDRDEEGGWGPRIIAQTYDGMYFIFAHLGETMPYREGFVLAPGDVFAWVGNYPENGNWFPHLHVQMFKGTLGDIEKIDGYGNALKTAELARKHPHPLIHMGDWW